MSKIKTTLKIIGAAAALGCAAWTIKLATAPAYDGSAGIQYGKAFAPARDTNVKFHMWYPANPGGRAVTVGGNGVFYGTPAGKNAPRRAGKFPLILISHGSGGNAGQFGWIAEALATAGYVVVLPNHPGTTTGDASAEAAMRLWERPQDLSAVIDALEAALDAYPFIDMDRIATLGFSAGGYTAMALTGARLDPARLNAFCDQDTGLSDCTYFKLRGIDLHDVDFGPAAQDLHDARIKASVVIDPGTIQAMTDESLRTIDVPLQILNLGDAGTVPIGVDAAHAAQLIDGSHHINIAGAWHFSFLAECKAKGARILEKEGELDPLCDEVSDRNRADIHEELKGKITTFLKQNL